MAKSKKSRRQAAGGNGSSSAQSSGGKANDAEKILKQDHRKVEQLFKQFENADEQQKEEIAIQVCRELVVHSLLEEEVFYPACRDKGVEDDALDEAQVEHDSVKMLVNDLRRGPRDPYYDAKMTVLSEYVKHHVKEEEKQGTGIFAKARKAGVDMAELGTRLEAFKRRIEAESGQDVPPATPRALGIQSTMFNRNPQEMMHMERDRDDRGRFRDDDDDRGGRGGGGGRGHGRGGWFGDSEGHSRAGQQRGSSSGRYQEDDDRGGRGGRSGGGGRGQGGWFGDPEGHSRAAQQRGSSSGRYEDDDDNGGRGGRFGRERDEQGRFMSDDDDDRGGRSGGGGRGHGRGGWFGDSEGHSRAAQQRGSSGRYDDDDNNGGRGGRGGGRDRDEQGRFTSDDDDDRGGRGGRGGGSRGQGQGGWFGDSRGHSEASRRGWRDRD